MYLQRSENIIKSRCVFYFSVEMNDERQEMSNLVLLLVILLSFIHPPESFLVNMYTIEFSSFEAYFARKFYFKLFTLVEENKTYEQVNSKIIEKNHFQVNFERRQNKTFAQSYTKYVNFANDRQISVEFFLHRISAENHPSPFICHTNLQVVGLQYSAQKLKHLSIYVMDGDLLSR